MDQGWLGFIKLSKDVLRLGLISQVEERWIRVGSDVENCER